MPRTTSGVYGAAAVATGRATSGSERGSRADTAGTLVPLLFGLNDGISRKQTAARVTGCLNAAQIPRARVPRRLMPRPDTCGGTAKKRRDKASQEGRGEVVCLLLTTSLNWRARFRRLAMRERHHPWGTQEGLS